MRPQELEEVATLRMPAEPAATPLQSPLTDKLVRGLGSMRRRNVLCDLLLTCKGVKFTVHKCVLAASSEYFHAMFTSGLEETRAGHVELHEVDPDALDVLLDIIYGEPSVHLTGDRLEPVLSAAHMLQLDPIYEYCCQLLAERLTCYNFLQVWDLADKYSSDFLQEKVQQFCIRNFRKITHDGEFLSMSLERIVSLLASNDLNITSEDAVLDVVISWVNAEREIRGPLLHQLLSSVRFDLLTQDMLCATVNTDPWMAEAFKAFGQRTKDIESCLKGIANTKSNNQKCRNPKYWEPVLVVFGENQDSDTIMQCYSFQQEKWYPAKGLPVPMSKMGLVSYDNQVYLIGGFDGNKYLSTVLMYDVMTGRFKCVSNMHHKRCDVGVQELDGYIYAVGGYDGHNYLREVEYYDPKQNVWKAAAPLLQGRAGAAATSFNGLLFVVGGYDGKAKAERRMMEFYNPDTDQWTKVGDMEFGLWNAGVGLLNGCLYSVGGYKLNAGRKPSPSSAVMCFSSRDRSWKVVHHLPVEAIHTSVVTWDDRLYIMTPQGRLFAYDPCTERWWELVRATNIRGELRGSYASATLVYKAIEQNTTANKHQQS